MTGRMLERIEQVCWPNYPTLRLLYSETNYTLAGALAAGKLHIPVAQVEAGAQHSIG